MNNPVRDGVMWYFKRPSYKLRDNLFVQFSLIKVIYTALVFVVRKNLTNTLQYNRLRCMLML